MNELDAPGVSTEPRAEIEQLLEADQSRLGDIYRWRREGKTPQQIAEVVGATNGAFTYPYFFAIDAALDGTVPAARSARRAVLGSLKSLIRKGRQFPVSPEALRMLVEHRAVVEASTAEMDELSAAEAEHEEREQAKRTLADLEGVPGIYAFSYGWYLEHPYDEQRGTTFIKVGRAVDIGRRIRDHTGEMGGDRAHMPEPLALVRAYSKDDLSPVAVVQLEKQFHRLLAAAGHENPRRVIRQVGTEWFLTNTEFLDEIAEVLGLNVLFEGQSEFTGVA
jgi:hypothetical protein